MTIGTDMLITRPAAREAPSLASLSNADMAALYREIPWDWGHVDLPALLSGEGMTVEQWSRLAVMGFIIGRLHGITLQFRVSDSGRGVLKAWLALPAWPGS